MHMLSGDIRTHWSCDFVSLKETSCCSVFHDIHVVSPMFGAEQVAHCRVNQSFSGWKQLTAADKSTDESHEGESKH